MWLLIPVLPLVHIRQPGLCRCYKRDSSILWCTKGACSRTMSPRCRGSTQEVVSSSPLSSSSSPPGPRCPRPDSESILSESPPSVRSSSSLSVPSELQPQHDRRLHMRTMRMIDSSSSTNTTSTMMATSIDSYDLDIVAAVWKTANLENTHSISIQNNPGLYKGSGVRSGFQRNLGVTSLLFSDQNLESGTCTWISNISCYYREKHGGPRSTQKTITNYSG